MEGAYQLLSRAVVLEKGVLTLCAASGRNVLRRRTKTKKYTIFAEKQIANLVKMCYGYKIANMSEAVRLEKGTHHEIFRVPVHPS